ncbi:hypothetical protein TBLA_0H03370 [Henningerozyma blattae CBS 6284]|uniref:Glycosyltransferase family 15 protein n=1 Tax=Henningerozyma blattae (strain ATCC 34711 / CBS 6284 / DSM 70876 / NBRC 10599 / NRRL Y-10934 / UCD 77-7) TaxID=1071380 RepID=I2H8B6_HENB6|nr:hypothetical protein TBLA_0H03370 [Tetrapisispora blattae CBS 6284]CCH62618.1 hypothetical protein TBLA_0H03370 [Tetrapisispora blattae CBS 6284]
MSIHISKRITRVVLIIVLVVVSISVLSNHATTQDIYKDYVPTALDFSAYYNDDSPKLPSGNSKFDFAISSVSSLGALPSADPSIWKKQKEDDEFKKKLAKAKEEAKKAEENPDDKDHLYKFLAPSFANEGRRPSAVLISVINVDDDLQKILETVYSVETKFNNKLKYPWVFISKDPLPEPTVSTIESVLGIENCKFGTIPESDWAYPSYIDKNKAAVSRAQMFKLDFGSSESYRHMARYLSGLIWEHPLLQGFDWYWRIDPGSVLTCDIQYDLFRWMQDTGKVFGFTLSGREEPDTMKTLWDKTRNYIDSHKNIHPDLRGFVTNAGEAKAGKNDKITKNDDYNNCYFWSNSELGNLNYWRSPLVKNYFDYLDHEGGFFYERWADHTVHTLSTVLFLEKRQFHFFPDVGFSFGEYKNCPLEDFLWKENNCACDQGDDNSFRKRSCTGRYYESIEKGKPEGHQDHDY